MDPFTANSLGFQSTPPVKAATHGFGLAVTPRKRFQSTPPVKAATAASGSGQDSGRISIHAAREGGDGHAINQR